jgi:hypothetical protein
MSARTYIRPAISLLLITLTVLGLNNVYANNDALQQQAEGVACAAEPCSARLIQLERTVLAQTFTFDARSPEQGRAASRTAVVKCQREFIFAGGYHCEAQ